MPSPFPGMNPFLEQEDAWHDFHEQFCIECRNAVLQQLPPAYIAKLDENVYIHELPEDQRRLFARGDVTVARENVPAGRSSRPGTLAAPFYGRVLPYIEFQRDNFVEIRDGRTRELVTVIELLSPSNKKPGSDREQFLNKRWQLMTSTAHYVEIDLLRGGPRLPVEDLPECDYYAMVSRVEERPKVGLWPFELQDPMPEIPIPLRDPDSDLLLNLQTLLHRAYDAGGYERYIYQGAPEPPLSADQESWARGHLPR